MDKFDFQIPIVLVLVLENWTPIGHKPLLRACILDYGSPLPLSTA